MKLKPLYDRLIVKREAPESVTASGIVLPESGTEKPDTGKVIAVGTGRLMPDNTLKALQVAVGDTVMFGKYSGQAIKAEGEELLVMREDDIFAIVG